MLKINCLRNINGIHFLASCFRRTICCYCCISYVLFVIKVLHIGHHNFLRNKYVVIFWLLNSFIIPSSIPFVFVKIKIKIENINKLKIRTIEIILLYKVVRLLMNSIIDYFLVIRRFLYCYTVPLNAGKCVG